MHQGCDLETASKFLGMTVKALEERYCHHPDHRKKAAKAIGQRRAK